MLVFTKRSPSGEMLAKRWQDDTHSQIVIMAEISSKCRIDYRLTSAQNMNTLRGLLLSFERYQHQTNRQTYKQIDRQTDREKNGKSKRIIVDTPFEMFKC